MHKQKKAYKALALLAGITLAGVQNAHAELERGPALPSMYGKTLTTPVAWGAAYGTVFGTIGGTAPAAYTSAKDGAIIVGAGIGDPVKYMGIQVGLVALDLSDMSRYGLNVRLHRYLGNGNAIAIGAEDIILQDSASPSDAKESYYIVYSQAVQSDFLMNRKTNRSKLHFSIGIGTGRFEDKSEYDMASGKGSYGTSVFGNVSYELFGFCNVIADWNGLNLSAGVSKSIELTDNITVGGNLGVSDLTSNSGDRKRVIGGVGVGIEF